MSLRRPNPGGESRKRDSFLRNKKGERRISCFMEKQTGFYYIGIEKEKETEGEARRKPLFFRKIREGRIKAEPLSLYRMKEPLPFAGGRAELAFSFLKEASLAEWEKPGKRKGWTAALLRAKEEAEGLWEGGVRMIWDERLEKVLGRRSEPLLLSAPELFGACLWRAKDVFSLETLSLSLPEEGGVLLSEALVRLLMPFLQRVNRVSFVGPKGEAACLLEDFLYQEYGILSAWEKKPKKKRIWIDVSDRKDGLLERFARENGIYRLDEKEVLNFLDTTVKNGYNTKVN